MKEINNTPQEGQTVKIDGIVFNPMNKEKGEIVRDLVVSYSVLAHILQQQT